MNVAKYPPVTWKPQQINQSRSRILQQFRKNTRYVHGFQKTSEKAKIKHYYTFLAIDILRKMMEFAELWAIINNNENVKKTCGNEKYLENDDYFVEFL